MTYVLAQNVAAVQTIANVQKIDGSQSGNPIAQPASGQAPSPPQNQAFEITVTGPGTVSATAQIVASNDGINWVNYGSTIAAASAFGTSSATGLGNTPFVYFSAYITAISGTGAKATVTMNA